MKFLLKFALLCILISFLAVQDSLAAEPRAGEEVIVNVRGVDGVLEVRFHYCPEGELLRGKPKPLAAPSGNAMMDKITRGAALATLSGYYIGETEVSQKQYKAVMGASALETVLDRMLAGDSGGKGDAFPIRGVTVFEAAAFCEALNEIDQSSKSSTGSIEDRRFRLPTRDEWQYACRTIGNVEKTEERPHFGTWPKIDDIPGDVRSDCEDVWKKNFADRGNFVGTQDQVFDVAAKHENPRRAVEILSAFMKLALGNERDFATTATEPQPVGSGTRNDWGLFNMHGNVFEWVLAEKDGARLSKIQKMLAEQNEVELNADKGQVFFLAGGGYNYSLGQNVSDWITFSSWGGHPMKDGEPSGYTFSELESQNVVEDAPPGFRVVLERILAKDWILIVRLNSVLGETNAMERTTQSLNANRLAVAELSTGRERSLAEARIDYYEAMAAYRSGDKQKCVKLLEKSKDPLSGEDPYFDQLLKLLVEEVQ
ncbi:formylglycine-generating enzyme family protein [Novipirellula sp.]|uniref:formylglycine-generating enzyme family protein n=1 Tax=Novipirellula sp. TaxID=2795430 RepID=UPI0035618C43